MSRCGIVVDLFAGGGGASVGIEAALRRPVDVAINHSALALAVHAANHPRTTHLTADIWEVKPREVTRGRPVEVLWASPDCTHFSVAKGGTPRERGIRSLAYDLSAARSKAAQVRLIGNSVCPEVAEALVRANAGTSRARRSAA